MYKSLDEVAEQLNKDYRKTIINDQEYQIKLLPTELGWTAAEEILQIVLPSAGAGIDGLRNQDADLFGATDKTFKSVMEALSLQLGNRKLIAIIRGLLNEAKVNNRPLDFNEHFKGNYGELLLLVEFALRENFSSFFTDAGLRTRILNLLKGLIPTQELEVIQE